MPIAYNTSPLRKRDFYGAIKRMSLIRMGATLCLAVRKHLSEWSMLGKSTLPWDQIVKEMMFMLGRKKRQLNGIDGTDFTISVPDPQTVSNCQV